MPPLPRIRAEEHEYGEATIKAGDSEVRLRPAVACFLPGRWGRLAHSVPPVILQRLHLSRQRAIGAPVRVVQGNYLAAFDDAELAAPVACAPIRPVAGEQAGGRQGSVATGSLRGEWDEAYRARQAYRFAFSGANVFRCVQPAATNRTAGNTLPNLGWIGSDVLTASDDRSPLIAVRIRPCG